jgi:hypothetical protein
MTPGNLQVSLEKVLNPTGQLIWQIRGGPDFYALFLLKEEGFLVSSSSETYGTPRNQLFKEEM